MGSNLNLKFVFLNKDLRLGKDNIHKNCIIYMTWWMHMFIQIICDDTFGLEEQSTLKGIKET